MIAPSAWESIGDETSPSGILAVQRGPGSDHGQKANLSVLSCGAISLGLIMAWWLLKALWLVT